MLGPKRYVLIKMSNKLCITQWTLQKLDMTVSQSVTLIKEKIFGGKNPFILHVMNKVFVNICKLGSTNITNETYRRCLQKPAEI